MADETPNGDAAQAQGQAPAQMNVLSQYVKNLEFDNAAAKRGRNPSAKPSINVQVNVEHQRVSENRFGVTLMTKVNAKADDDDIFNVDLDYVGVFQLTNVPENALAAVLSIECPRLLFPFSRRIIAEVTRDGGFPPLMLDPIDFATLFRQQAAQRAAQQTASETA